nr:hypothetical protein [Planctomycetota bacterium]
MREQTVRVAGLDKDSAARLVASEVEGQHGRVAAQGGLHPDAARDVGKALGKGGANASDVAADVDGGMNFQGGLGGRQRDRLATRRHAVGDARQGLHERRATDEGSQSVPVGQRLAIASEVGLDAKAQGSPAAMEAKARDHLVEDEHDVVAAGQGAHAFQVTGQRRHVAHRLQDQGCNTMGMRIEDRSQAVEVVVGDAEQELLQGRGHALGVSVARDAPIVEAVVAKVQDAFLTRHGARKAHGGGADIGAVLAEGDLLGMGQHVPQR